jgi:hypothetical protein
MNSGSERSELNGILVWNNEQIQLHAMIPFEKIC